MKNKPNTCPSCGSRDIKKDNYDCSFCGNNQYAEKKQSLGQLMNKGLDLTEFDKQWLMQGTPRHGLQNMQWINPKPSFFGSLFSFINNFI